MKPSDDPRSENRPPTNRDHSGAAYTATVNWDSEDNPLGAMLLVSVDALDAFGLTDAESIRLNVADDGATVVDARDDAEDGTEP